MYLTFPITDNSPLTRPTDWDGARLTGDHALFVVAEEKRTFGEPPVVQSGVQTPKWKGICDRANHWAIDLLLSIEIFLHSQFPSETCCVSISRHPSASLSNDTSCRIFLLSHKVPFYGNLNIKSTPLCTSTSTLVLFSCHPVWTETNTSFCPAVCCICSPYQQYCHVL